MPVGELDDARFDELELAEHNPQQLRLDGHAFAPRPAVPPTPFTVTSRQRFILDRARTASLAPRSSGTAPPPGHDASI